MELEIPLFLDYLENTKNASRSTVVSYERDLKRLEMYLSESGVDSLAGVTPRNLSSYLADLEKKGLSAATVSRNVASMRAFFRYICCQNKMENDPTETIRAPHIDKKAPDVLTAEEVTRLLEQPSGDSPKELRDRAMLELLYATGMRVSELISLKLKDVSLKMNYVICRDGEKERVIPFGVSAKEALERYMKQGREALLKEEGQMYLFVNCSGNPMSRQGFWKLIKQYARKAGIYAEITPHTLRHCFAAHLLENGADIKSVQEMLGHSNVSTTQIYQGLHIGRMRNMYEQVHPRM